MTVWLFGDSIFRGSRLDKLPCPAEIRTPSTLLATLSGLEVRLHHRKLNVSEKPSKSARFISRCKIQPGDSVVLQDVGEHSQDPDQHEAGWRAVIEAAERPGVRLLVLESFNGEAARHHRYDVPFNGRTMNDAQRAAVNGATLVPLMEPLSAFQQQAGVGYLRDQVHLDVWGQLRLCRLITDALGAEPRGRKTLADLMVQHFGAAARRVVKAALS